MECVNPMGIHLMTKPWNPKLSIPPHWKLSLRHKNRCGTTHIQTTGCRLNLVSPQAHALNTWCPLGGTILGGSGNLGGGRLFRVSPWGFIHAHFLVYLTVMWTMSAITPTTVNWTGWTYLPSLVDWDSLNQWATVNPSFLNMFLSGTRLALKSNKYIQELSSSHRQVPRLPSDLETSCCPHDGSIGIPSFQCSSARYFCGDLFYSAAICI